MNGHQNKICVNLSPEARRRLEIIVAFTASCDQHGERPTYKQVIEYLIDQAPVDEMLSQLMGAQQPLEETENGNPRTTRDDQPASPPDRSAPADGAGRRGRKAKQGNAPA